MKTNTTRLIALLLLVLLVAAACAAPETTSTGSAGSAQPAATATPAPEPAAAPVAQPTEAPASDTANPAVEAPAQDAAPAESPATSGGGQRTFAIDPANTVASYEVDEEFLAGALGRLGIAAGLTKTVGRTSEVQGTLAMNFDGSVPQFESGEFTVDISTLSSDQRMRDNRIRGDWLESSRYPMATFTATEIRNAPASYSEGEEAQFQLAGDLTIRDMTNPAVFDVTAALDGDTITGVATTGFKMTDFGFEPPAMANLLTVGDDTVIRIEFTAMAQ